jgi:hypothetical protein
MRSRYLVLGLIVGLFAWYFAAALFGSDLFVFRDAADFYQPLFQFTRSQWLCGSLPLWNPYENLGMPLAGNATSSVFYPGTQIFLLPWDYAWSYKIYVLAHVLLAAATAYRTARRFGSSVEASGLCALCYAFGGNVLYQYTNVVFLVGAAWLPAALEAADRMLVGRSFAAAVGLGVILALMTLGGDPQAAYHAGLLAATYALGLWWCERRDSLGGVPLRFGWHALTTRSVGWACSARPPTCLPAATPREGMPPDSEVGAESVHPTPRTPRPARFLRSRPALLAVAAAIGFLLAAVAVLPSIEFAAHSERSASRVARSIYEISGCLRHPDAGTRIVRGLTARVDPGSHEEHVYQFSVGPWRLVEYFWPNFSGRQFPENRRWLDALPWEGRIWVPSFYMGLLPLLLALVRLRLRGTKVARGDSPLPQAGEGQGVRVGGKIPGVFQSPSPSPGSFLATLSRAREREELGRFRTRWLSWIVLLSVIASFGWYGLGCLESLRVEILGRGTPVVDPPFGGLYWLMTMLLPGYIQFRYPAKLLTVAALGLAMLAAQGWDQVLWVEPRRVRRALLSLGAVSLFAALVALAIRPFWNGWFAHAEPNPLFGPLDTVGAAGDLLRSLLHATILCGLLAWLVKGRAGNGSPALRHEGRAGSENHAHRRVLSVPPKAAVLLLLTALDLATANGWMVACAPQHLWQEPPRMAAAIAAQEKLRGDEGPFRVFRDPDWLPQTWQSSRSPQRLAEALAWDRATLWPNHNLPAAIALAEVYGTMIPLDYRTLLWAAGDAELARKHTAAPSEPGLKLPEGRPALDLLGAKYLILPGADSLADTVRLPLPLDAAGAALDDVSFFYNPRHFARAWIVHQVTTLPPLADADLDAVRRRTEEVLLRDGRPRDFRREAVVEACGVWGAGGGANVHPISESCRITHYQPQRVMIDVRLARPGLVVLCDQYYPGWRLTVETEGQPPRETPIVRTNRVMRGVWLSAGAHRLTYAYRPATFYYGAILSGLGWLAVAGWIVWVALTSRQCLPIARAVGIPTRV